MLKIGNTNKAIEQQSTYKPTFQSIKIYGNKCEKSSKVQPYSNTMKNLATKHLKTHKIHKRIHN